MQYDDLVHIRKDDIQGETNWVWPISDDGAWTGPRNDWISNHSDKYFKYLEKMDVVVTAGANCGMHVRFFAKKFKKVYAFEPDPLNFHCMVNNCQYDNVIKLQAALGDECKLVGLNNDSKGNVGVHTVQPGELYPMLTIDTLNLDACDLIQLDVEGYERFIIKGAVETIKKYRPVITAENGHTCEDILIAMGYEGVDQSASDKVFQFKK